MLDAVILGLVEGITEFLPVSSTGHLIIVSKLLRFEGEVAKTFEIFIQLGAILAVVILYWRRFLGLIDFKTSSAFSGISGLKKIAVACAPAFVLGAVLHSFIKQHLFSYFTVGIGFIVGAILFVFVEKRKIDSHTESLEELSLKDAFLIGLAQCLALWPGMSRSGSTMIGAMWLGCSRKVAAEFSFLIAVPVMCAAVGFDLLKSFQSLSSVDIPLFATGFIVAFLSALGAVKFFIGYLSQYTLIPFAVYRILIGLLIVNYL